MRWKIFLLALALLLIIAPVCYANVDMTKIDRLGKRILLLVRGLGKWVLLTSGLLQALKSGMHGDQNGVIKATLAALMMWGSFFLIEIGFELVEEAFQ